jgi:plastocyanin
MKVALIRRTLPRAGAVRTQSHAPGAPNDDPPRRAIRKASMTTTRQRSLIAVVGLALAAAPVAASTAGVAGAASTKTVTMKNIRYSPSAVTIARGDSVRWNWRDGSIRHDVRFSNGGLKASPLKSAGTYRLTFRKKGTFRFFCSVHSEMKGRVTVR